MVFWFIVLLVCVARCAVFGAINTSGKADNAELTRIKYNSGQRFIFFPDGNGRIHLVDLEQTVIDNRYNIMKDVFASIYSSYNSTPVTICAENKTSILNYADTIDFNKPFKVVVHGWRDNGNNEMSVEIRNAYLRNMDVNVIVIDWGPGASTHYGTAVMNVPKTGEFLANLIIWLVENGVPIENFHLIGHSLGAHIVGIAGRILGSGNITYITGLDPAAPCWDNNSKRIRKTDGEYVEIIHTNMGLVGIQDAIGSNDFYPNGGASQPGCGIFALACAHKRAYKYFADSIEHNKFKAMQCTNLKELIERKCANLTTLYMGGSTPKSPVGVFYLQTRKQSPFYFN